MPLSVNAGCTQEFSGNQLYNCTHICYTEELFLNHLCDHVGPHSGCAIHYGYRAWIFPYVEKQYFCLKNLKAKVAPHLGRSPLSRPRQSGPGQFFLSYT